MAWALVQLFPISGGPDNSLPGGGGRPDQGLPGWGGGATDPGYGHPIFGGRPDQGLPGGGWRPTDPGFGVGGGRPDQGLPGGGHISNRPPGQPLPPHIGGRPPQGGNYPSGGPVPPTGTPHGVAAATAPPEKVDPNNGAWVLVALGDGMVVWAWAQPQNTGGGGQPDQGLPPGQPHPDQGLPSTPPPTAGQPLPPTAQPKK